MTTTKAAVAVEVATARETAAAAPSTVATL